MHWSSPLDFDACSWALFLFLPGPTTAQYHEYIYVVPLSRPLDRQPCGTAIALLPQTLKIRPTSHSLADAPSHHALNTTSSCFILQIFLFPLLVAMSQNREKNVCHCKFYLSPLSLPPLTASKLHTDLGDLKIEVFCESVPKTAEVCSLTLRMSQRKNSGFTELPRTLCLFVL